MWLRDAGCRFGKSSETIGRRGVCRTRCVVLAALVCLCVCMGELRLMGDTRGCACMRDGIGVDNSL